jgi:hypothetical protein
MNINTKSLITGIILIALGIILLGDNLGFFYVSMDTFWPWFMIAAGAFFLVGWMSNREKYGLLMPATILLVYGFLFLYTTHGRWWRMEDLWPFFLIGPGLGFLLMYQFGTKDKGLLVPASILLGLGIIFLIGEGTGRFFWPLLLILLGILVLFRSKRKEKEIPEAEELKPETPPEAKKPKKKK